MSTTNFKNEINFRMIKNKKELEELQLLHQEWFPIDYSYDYFEAALDGRISAIIAEITIKKKNRLKEKVMIGCIIYRLKHIKCKYMKINISSFFNEYLSMYIMTLGVVNEFRNKGIATMLLEEMMNRHEDNLFIKYVYLHVVDYNIAAIKFYEKNDFEYYMTREKHYNIESKKYDAYVYVKYINGGEKPRTYKQTFKSIFWFINVPGHCYRIIKSAFNFGKK